MKASVKIQTRVVILGAGFGGLELATILSEKCGDILDIILIDKEDAFVFGFSKLDIMIGRISAERICYPYSAINKPGVRFYKRTIKSIDPVKRRVTTNKGIFNADFLVIALGTDYDMDNTLSIKNGGNEFYTVSGATVLSKLLPKFTNGSIVVGVTSTPFKCPPAPSEAVLLLDDFFTKHGVRNDIDITLVMPFGVPIPPSPHASKAILETFKERGIRFIPNQIVVDFNPSLKQLELQDEVKILCDMFLGVPKHKVPSVIESSSLTENEWIPVNPKTLKTRFPNVFAIGDVTSVGTPKAGVFSEGAARIVADLIISKVRGTKLPLPYKGNGICYMEFGYDEVGRVYVDFLSGPRPTGTFEGPSKLLTQEKSLFASSRIKRWFGL